MKIFEEYLPIVDHAYHSIGKYELIQNKYIKKYINKKSNKNKSFPYNIIDVSGSRANGKTINVIRAILFHMMICKDDIMIFRFIQKSIRQSSHSTIINEIKENNLIEYFDIKQNYIRCKLTGATISYMGLWGQEMNVRSLSPSFKLIIIEEAANVTGELWDILLPTVLRFERILIIPIYNITTISNPTYIRFHEDKSKETLHIFGTIFDNPYIPKAMIDRCNKDKEIMTIEEWNMHYLGIPQLTLNSAIFNNTIMDKMFDLINYKIDKFDKVIVSYDPAISDKKISEEDKSNSHGICVVGLKNNICYLLDSYSEVASPDIACNKVVEFYKEYQADYVLFEENQGGLFIKSVILNIDNTIQIKSFRSITNKIQRATQLVLPINNNQIKLYDNPYIKQLQDQMRRMTTNGFIENYKNESPDILDAFGFAIIDLLNLNIRNTINHTLPSSIQLNNMIKEASILLVYTEANIVYSVECTLYSKDNDIYLSIDKTNNTYSNVFELDKMYDILFIDKQYNNLDKYNDINVIDILPFSQDLLNDIKSIQILDNTFLNIWNNYAGNKDNDHIFLRLVLYLMNKI